MYVGREGDRTWTLTTRSTDVVPSFVDLRSKDLLGRVSAEQPDVVVVFGPQRLEPGVARGFPGATVAYLLESVEVPLSRDGSPWRLAELRDEPLGPELVPASGRFDATEYDRILAADPRITFSADAPEVWRSPPLPVDDALYRAVDTPLAWARPLFIGEATAYREIFLREGKHYYDLRHCTFDLAGERLAQVLGEATIGVAPSHGPFATFEAAAPLHLAAGHLLLAGPLVPPRGLESGLDHLTFYGPGDFAHLLYEIHSRPAAFEVIRQRGRVRAEEFRASRIWPRLLRDLFLDLDAFGSPRRALV